MFIRPTSREKDARPEQNVLEMTVHCNSSNLSEHESAECGRVPSVIVIRRKRHLGREKPCSSNVKAIRSEISCDVGPATVQLQALSTCSVRQHEYRQT